VILQHVPQKSREHSTVLSLQTDVENGVHHGGKILHKTNRARDSLAYATGSVNILPRGSMTAKSLKKGAVEVRRLWVKKWAAEYVCICKRKEVRERCYIDPVPTVKKLG